MAVSDNGVFRDAMPSEVSDCFKRGECFVWDVILRVIDGGEVSHTTVIFTDGDDAASYAADRGWSHSDGEEGVIAMGETTINTYRAT